jgi:hypothetical protein
MIEAVVAVQGSRQEAVRRMLRGLLRGGVVEALLVPVVLAGGHGDAGAGE